MAIAFGGNNAIDCGNFDLPAGTDTITVTAWLSLANASRNEIIFGKTNGSTQYWSLETNGKRLRGYIRVGNSTANARTSNNTIDANGILYFVYMRYTGSQIEVGVIDPADGIPVTATTTKNGIIADDPGTAVQIGGLSTGGAANIEGEIDDCRLYTRVLTDKELDQIWQFPGQDFIFDDLYARYVLNEGFEGRDITTVASFRDWGENNFNGTPVGPAGNSSFMRSDLITSRRRA